MELTRCAAIQFNIALGEVNRNLATVETALARVAEQGAQLVVLPEMWSSGYDYKRLAKHAAETPRVVEAVCKLSAQYNMVVVGSLPEESGGKIFNTAYVLDRGEVLDSYRKLHMFSTMGEDRFLSPGDRSLVVSTSAGRLGVAICYDLRFPELFRKMAVEKGVEHQHHVGGFGECLGRGRRRRQGRPEQGRQRDHRGRAPAPHGNTLSPGPAR